MRVAVTGAGSRLGRLVVASLIRDGHEVVGLDARGAREGDGLAAALTPETTVVHLAELEACAAQRGASSAVEARRRLLEANVYATMRLLDGARRGVAALVLASSHEVYGGSPTPVDESAPTAPTTDYGATKLAAEDHLFAFAAEQGTRVVSLRCATVYGPHVRSDAPIDRAIDAEIDAEIDAAVDTPIDAAIEAAHRGLPLTLDGAEGDLVSLLHVEDAARAVALAVASTAEGVFNVGPTAPASLGEIARTVLHLAGGGGAPRFRGGAAPRHALRMVVERARAELGFEPAFSLARGIASRYASYRTAEAPR